MAYVEIVKLATVFEPKVPTIKFGQSALQITKALKAVDDQVAEFKVVADDLAIKHAAEACPAVKKVIARWQRKILVSALAPAITSQYAAQLEVNETYEAVKEFVTATLTPDLDPELELNSARRELAQLTRFSAQNEKFVKFLERVRVVAKPVVEHASQSAAEMLIGDVWKRNLAPRQKQFLAEHGQSVSKTVTMGVAAAFLDERGLHLAPTSRPQVQSLEAGQLEALQLQNATLTAQVNQLTRQNGEFKAELENLSSILENQLSSSASPQGAPGVPRAPRAPAGTRPPRFRNTPRSARPPTTCQRCGERGHDKPQCPKAYNDVRCTYCGFNGHVAALCRRAQAKN